MVLSRISEEMFNLWPGMNIDTNGIAPDIHVEVRGLFHSFTSIRFKLVIWSLFVHLFLNSAVMGYFPQGV